MNDQQRAAMQVALPDYPDRVSIADVEYAQCPKPESWSDEHFKCWQDLQVASRNIAILRKHITALRKALAQPQGEPVAWMRENEDCTDCFVWERDEEHTIPLYTTPPSVEAAIEATKEKAAKVCDDLARHYWMSDAEEDCEFPDAHDCSEAIRKMDAK